jgi:hypothetical protein
VSESDQTIASKLRKNYDKSILQQMGFWIRTLIDVTRIFVEIEERLANHSHWIMRASV